MGSLSFSALRININIFVSVCIFTVYRFSGQSQQLISYFTKKTVQMKTTKWTYTHTQTAVMYFCFHLFLKKIFFSLDFTVFSSSVNDESSIFFLQHCFLLNNGNWSISWPSHMHAFFKQITAQKCHIWAFSSLILDSFDVKSQPTSQFSMRYFFSHHNYFLLFIAFFFSLSRFKCSLCNRL